MPQYSIFLEIMPNCKRDHEESRKVICVLCFKKPKGQLRGFSDKMKDIFLKYVIADQSNCLTGESLDWLPLSLCLTCRRFHNNVEKNPASLIKHIDYESLIPPQYFRGLVVTRSTIEEDCNCSVCEVARMDNVGLKYLKYKEMMSDPKGKTPWLISKDDYIMENTPFPESKTTCQKFLS